MKKISIKLKLDKHKNKKSNPCPICGQHMDICVTSHKNKPFIDNNFYSKMCFTCYSVPKTSEQKYDENGYIKEEIDLEYNHKNLNTAEQLVHAGSADSLEQAKKCLRSVKSLKIKKEIKNKYKPKFECQLNDD